MYNPGAQEDMVGIIFKKGDGKIQETAHIQYTSYICR